VDDSAHRMNRGRIRRSPLRPMALEPRIMFDAAAVHTAAAAANAAEHADTPSDTSHDASASANEVQAPAAVLTNASPANEVVFVDERVPDYEQLVTGARPDVQIVVIRSGQDGLSTISSTLADRSGITAIHVVSHGSPGSFLLGTAVVDSTTLSARESEVAAWAHSLTSSADLLVYGCDVAATPSGRTLIDSLSRVTGADVAASADDTGGSGGDWTLEYGTGGIEAPSFLAAAATASYANRLSTFNLSGSSGWTAVMYGTNRDPVGDSQAGAADTDIVGDASHGSLYVAFDDNGTATSSDDTLVFRLRIDNPTSSSNFSGVAVVGMDTNLDGRLDIFMSVDGRNNGQAVKLLDPGTGANVSPSTTSTAPLPTGWLPNNGVYSFTSLNYSVVAVSAATDPHWNGDSDLGNDGKTDIFVNWRIPLNDLAFVLAKPSSVDRSGNYGPRGATGIAGYTQNTSVQYVNFTQTQNGPINGDLNGVGASYDKNATFAALGAFTSQMSASNPVPAGPTITITEPLGGAIGSDGIWSAAEDGSITLSGTSSSLAQGTQVTVSVSDGALTRAASGTVQSDGTWSATLTGGQSISGLWDGTLSIVATADPDGNAGTSNDVADSASIQHDRTPPAIGIDQLAAALSGKPTITGTSDLPNGSLVTVTLDPDNNAATTNLVYQVVVSGGIWSLNTTTVNPVSGTMPSGGLASFTKITATAVDAAGNSATAVAINRPTVTTTSSGSTTPVISGTWTAIAGDVLTVQINGATYTPAPAGNSWSIDLATASPSSGSLTPLVAGSTYSVTATVIRGIDSVADTTTSELTITNTPVKSVDISGGATANGTDTTPTISGTSANAGGFVIVRLDPGNDGNLADAVTYSVSTDGSGNWTLNTGSATPISGTAPAGGYIGAIGIVATDSAGVVSDAQVLTISTPIVTVGNITSAASADAFGQVNNSGAGASYLNATEDNSVTISGTATDGFTVDLVVSDASGNSVTASNIAVNSGAWSVSGLNLSNLDSGTLNVRATLSGTSLNSTISTVTHDTIPNRIFITNQTTIPKTQATISGSSTLGSGVSLTVTIRDSADTATIWTGTATTTASGDWSVTTPNGTNLVGANSGNVIIKVAATSTNTDVAGNITQQVVRNPQAVQNGAANTSDTINIGTIAGDGVITVDEIASGLTVTGTTNLTTAATSAFTVTVSDGTLTQTATVVSNNSGNWTATLTQSQVQALKNGQLVVTARVDNTTSGIAVSDVELPTLALTTPTLTISDDTPGTATGVVTFTFTFSESMTGFTASDITVAGGTKGTFAGSGNTYTLEVTPPANSSGTITVSVAASTANGANSGRPNAAASSIQAYNTTGAAGFPTLTIDADALAVQSRPLITGTTSLAAGAPIVIVIDPDNDAATNDTLTYSATVQSDGTWSLDIGSATPASGTLPADGLTTFAKITATATNAYGNSTSVVALDKPAVTSQITNDNTPGISGTWTNLAGDTLSVTVAPAGGGVGTTYTVGNGLTIVGNTWTVTTGALADGIYNVTATASRAGTDKVDITTSELVIDTAGTVDITGGATVSTNDPTPVTSGTTTGIEAGAVLTLRLDIARDGTYGLVYKTLVNADGSWSIDTATAIPFSGAFPASGLSGPTPMDATATDAAGNTGADTQSLNIDRTPPALGFTSGTRTPDSTPLITGTTDLAPLSTITVHIDPNNDGDWSDQHTYLATVQADQTWSVQTTTPVSGVVKVRATGTDAVGNAATIEAPLTIDPTAPTVAVDPVVTANSDSIADTTEDDAIIISGTTTGVADGGQLFVTITDGNITISDWATVSGGMWQLAPLNLSALSNGTITVDASYTDGGDVYPASTSFQHDKAAVVAIDSISEDTGFLADFITKDSTVAVAGSATAGATVGVVVRNAANDVVASFSVVANSGGQWSTAFTAALSAGQYTIYATTGVTTVSRGMTIVDAPTLVASNPADNAVSVGFANNLALTFSKNVSAGTGFITLYRADGVAVERFDVTAGQGDGGGTLTFNGTTGIAIDPGSDLALATGYYLTIDGTAVVDATGNAYAGISNSTSLNFETGGPVVNPPSQVVTIVSMTKDTGSSAVDFVTNDGSSGRTMSGTLSAGLGAGEVVEISRDGGGTWTTATTIGTNWTVTDAGSHSAGWTIQARVTSNTTTLSGSVASQLVTLDTSPPAAPAVNNLVTTSTAPTLTGTVNANAGETLTVLVNGATYTVIPTGTSWSLDLATATPTSGTLGTFVIGSSYPVTATVTDEAGNVTSDTTTNELTIAASAPSQTPLIVSMTRDTGTSSSDFITADGSSNRVVSGTLANSLSVGEIVELSFDGGNTWTPANTAGTTWSVTDPGSHGSNWSIQARITNSVTHASGPAATQAVVLDSAAPITPTVDARTTTELLPSLTGTATLAAGETLTVSINGATYNVVPVGGIWTLNLANATPVSGSLGSLASDTAYSVTATVTDVAGNTASDVTTSELTIQKASDPIPPITPIPPVTPTPPVTPPGPSAPAQTVAIVSMTKDTGTLATDFVTNDGTAGRTVFGTVSGALGPNEVVHVSLDGGTTWVTATVSSTQWTALDAGAHTGDWTIQARVVSTETQLVSAPAIQVAHLDFVSPAIPGVDAIVTTVVPPTLTGTASVQDGEVLTVEVNGATYVVVPQAGRWSLDLETAVPTSGVLATLEAGMAYAVTARVTDAAGNAAADASSGELTIAPHPVPPIPSVDPSARNVLQPPSTPIAIPSWNVVIQPIASSPAVQARADVPSSVLTEASTAIPGTRAGLDSLDLSGLQSGATSQDRGLYTRAEGFQVIVLRPDSAGAQGSSASGPALLVNRGIPDQQFDYSGGQIEVAIPRDAFAHTRNDALVSLTVLQASGEALPGWLIFDPRLGMLRGVPPSGMNGDIEIRVIARDQAGNQVEITFRVKIREASASNVRAIDSPWHAAAKSEPPAGKPGLTRQLRAEGTWGRAHETSRYVEGGHSANARLKNGSRGG
jgi:large repetitive protein